MDMSPEREVAEAEAQAMSEPAVVLVQQPLMRHGWLKFFIADLETNPRSQYKVHKWGMYYWLINFPLVTLLFFFAPGLWLRLGIFITLIYSIYANFATDYGSMSAAMAAFDMHGLPAIPGEIENAAHYSESAEIRRMLEEIHKHLTSLAPDAGDFPPQS
jgi:hypothetical protein